MAVIEVITAFYIEVPVAAVVFAALFLVGWWWLGRGSRIGAPVMLAVMFLIELAGLPTYERKTTADWVVQMTAGVVSALGLVAAVAEIVRSRRRSPAAS